jgi:hypothetical protein
MSDNTTKAYKILKIKGLPEIRGHSYVHIPEESISKAKAYFDCEDKCKLTKVPNAILFDKYLEENSEWTKETLGSYVQDLKASYRSQNGISKKIFISKTKSKSKKRKTEDKTSGVDDNSDVEFDKNAYLHELEEQLKKKIASVDKLEEESKKRRKDNEYRYREMVLIKSLDDVENRRKSIVEADLQQEIDMQAKIQELRDTM